MKVWLVFLSAPQVQSRFGKFEKAKFEKSFFSRLLYLVILKHFLLSK